MNLNLKYKVNPKFFEDNTHWEKQHKIISGCSYLNTTQQISFTLAFEIVTTSAFGVLNILPFGEYYQNRGFRIYWEVE